MPPREGNANLRESRSNGGGLSAELQGGGDTGRGHVAETGGCPGRLAQHHTQCTTSAFRPLGASFRLNKDGPFPLGKSKGRRCRWKPMGHPTGIQGSRQRNKNPPTGRCTFIPSYSGPMLPQLLRAQQPSPGPPSGRPSVSTQTLRTALSWPSALVFPIRL